MPRRTLDSLIALSAGYIALTGQCYLIVPHLMGGLGNTLPPTIAILGAIGLFCLGWVLNASITIERIKEALQSNAGILFDPQIVTGLTQLNEQDALRGLVQ